MIDRDDAWFVRLQEDVRTDLDANRRQTAAVVAGVRHWLGRLVHGIGMVAHAIMGPPEPPHITPAWERAERRARRRERRAGRRRVRRERASDSSDTAD
jgi:hypothetical protein